MRLRQTETQTSIATVTLSHGAGTHLSGGRTHDGDDLARARLFSLKAGTEMQAIIDADRPTHNSARSSSDTLAKGRDPVWLCERLGTIQRQAKRARARAIYRSAQDAMSLIQRCNAHMPIDWTRVDGRLFVLNKLLGQYEAGLDEIAPIETSDRPNSSESNLAAPTDVVSSPAFDPVHAIARNTLSALLPHASDEERSALTRLMDIDPSAEITTDVEITEKLTHSESDIDTAETPDQPAERVEWIMPDLVQSLLALGREYGKIVSVSHSLDDVLIHADKTQSVTERLYVRLGDLITGSLPLQGVGRIDLAECADGLRISGSGFDTFDIALPERIDPSLQSIADQLEAEPQESAIDCEQETPPRPPMITDDTEAELRKQLAALMDGGSGLGRSSS